MTAGAVASIFTRRICLLTRTIANFHSMLQTNPIEMMMMGKDGSSQHNHANHCQNISYVTSSFHLSRPISGAKISFIFILHPLLFHKIKVLGFFCNFVAWLFHVLLPVCPFQTYFRFSTVWLNQLKNIFLTEYLKNRDNDLTTVWISAFCIVMLSNNSF